MHQAISLPFFFYYLNVYKILFSDYSKIFPIFFLFYLYSECHNIKNSRLFLDKQNSERQGTHIFPCLQKLDLKFDVCICTYICVHMGNATIPGGEGAKEEL